MHGLTWGLDVSTNRRKTAAVALDWGEAGVARVVEVHHPLSTAQMVDLISEHRASRWAVDVPFGWPDKFVALMADRHDGALPADRVPEEFAWEKWRTREVAQRQTDRFLTEHEHIKTRPLPASFQLLGATAAMWVLVEARLANQGVVIDRAGINGNVCETYPAAGLAAWGLGKSKQTWEQLRSNFTFLRADEHVLPTLTSDDVCDAIVCALLARAHECGLTIPPAEDQLAAARREGWIHVSLESPERLIQGA